MSGYDAYLEPASTIGFVGLLFALLAFVPMIAFGLLGDFGGLTGAVAVGATVVGSLSILLVFGDAVRRRRAAKTNGGRSSEEESDVWALIPSWQYNGLYAESGASTRDEQEKALRETQERADETERYLRKRSN
jgi:hypothetical protein